MGFGKPSFVQAFLAGLAFPFLKGFWSSLKDQSARFAWSGSGSRYPHWQ